MVEKKKTLWYNWTRTVQIHVVFIVKKKKPDTKGPILYDFIPMQCLEVVNAEREKSDQWLLGGVGRGEGGIII